MSDLRAHSTLRSTTVEKDFEKGSDGFYFQHRKGRLDIRSLAKIDIDSIVRNVDVETLQENLENLCFTQLHEEDLRHYTDVMILKLFQLSQYTIEYLLHVQEQLASTLNTLATKYAKKKRSLYLKRKECQELLETSKQLKTQIAQKNKNVQVLESMIQESNQKSSEEVDSKPRSEIIKFFIAGPKGICVEFTMINTTLIKDIVNKAKEAFISRRSHRHRKGIEPVLKLMYQGKWLMNERTIAESDIRAGDTIVVSIDNDNDDDDDDSDDEVVPPVVQAPHVDANVTEYMKLQAESYKSIAQEMKSGFEAAIKTLAQQPNNNNTPTSDSMFNRLEDKWTRVELSVRQQLDTQMTHYDTLLKELLSRDSKPVVFGDLEEDNDNEELRTNLTESMKKITTLQSSLEVSDSELSSFRGILKRQQEEIEDLKRRLDATPKVVYQPVEPIVTVQPKSEVLPPKTEDPPKIVEPTIDYISDEEPEIEDPIVVEEKVEYTPPAVVEEVSAPAPVVEEPVDIEILLSAEHDLTSSIRAKEMTHTNSAVSCMLPRDLSADDLVFELRKAVSDKFHIPLGRVALVLESEVIMLGLDVDGAVFTPVLAATQAQAQHLLYRITTAHPVSDAQLDIIANTLSTKPSSTKDETLLRKSSTLEQQKFKKIVHRSWSDDEDDSMDEILDDHKTALHDALSDVSDRESLSQDEMEVKMRKLRKSQSALTPGLKSHLTTLQQSLSGALAKAEDSGSDDPYSSDKKAKSVGLKLLQRQGNSGTGSKSFDTMRTSQSIRSTEIFDHDGDDDDDGDDQYVLMRSLGGAPETLKSALKTTTPADKPRPSAADATKKAEAIMGSRRLSVGNNSVTSSLIIMDSIAASHTVTPGGDDNVLHLRTSDSSSKFSAPKRYSPPDDDDTTYTDEGKSDSKTLAIRRSSKGEDNACFEVSDTSISAYSSEFTDAKSTERRKSNNQTLGSAISDLTESGYQDAKFAETKESKSEFNESLNSGKVLKKSVDFSLTSSNDDETTPDTTTLSKPASKLIETTPSSTTLGTPYSNASNVSPFMDLKETGDNDDGDESLVLSESNDAFPFLEESLGGSTEDTRPYNK